MKTTKLLINTIIIISAILSFNVIATAESDGVYKYTIANKEVTITGVESTENFSGKQIIPITLGGYPVKKINASAFANCSNLVSLTVPDEVTSIGYAAFFGCDSLEELTIPKDIYGTEAASRFGFIFGYTNQDDGPILSPESRPLYPALSTIYTNGENKTYQNYTHCYKEWHTGVAYYHYRRYYYYNIPDSLKKVHITNDTSIDPSAFYNCSNIEEITLNNKITKIEEQAFYNCSNLKKLYFNGSKTDWDTVEIADNNTDIENSAKEFFFYVTVLGENNELIIQDKFKENSMLSIPKKEGYTAILYTDTNCTNKYDISTPITTNLILQLRYKKAETKTTVIEYGKFQSFSISVMNANKNNAIILALYNGTTLVESHLDYYKGEDITFITDKTYTNAKVLIWDDMTTLSPSGTPENIN